MTHKPDAKHVDALAAVIREVMPFNRPGAAALAEAILSHPASQWGPTLPAPNKVDLEADFRAWFEAKSVVTNVNTVALCDAIAWAEHLLQQRRQPAAAWPQISDSLIRSLICDILGILTDATYTALRGDRFAPIPEIRARLLEILELAAQDAAALAAVFPNLKQDAP
jgi:hypothetical protein